MSSKFFISESVDYKVKLSAVRRVRGQPDREAPRNGDYRLMNRRCRVAGGDAPARRQGVADQYGDTLGVGHSDNHGVWRRCPVEINIY